MVRKSSVAGSLAFCCLGLIGTALAQQPATRTVLQTVPTSDVEHPSGLIQGDEWAFVGNTGDLVAFEVDTRDDTNEGTSKLDALAILIRPDGTFAIWGDDNASCSRPPVCGYACPRVENFKLDQTGHWRIVVQDLGATLTGVYCTGGGYNLSLRGPSRVLQSLRLRVNDGAIQQPAGLREEVERRKGLDR
jgi:hypothetical protein